MMLFEDNYDVIVVGAGIIGIASAYYCQKDGNRVLLLEQFAFPHSRGSSHGHSRITRKAIHESMVISQMMTEAHELWKSIEMESGTQLLKECGTLYVEKNPAPKLTQLAAVSDQLGYRYSLLDDATLANRYGSVFSFPGYTGLLDHEGGLLRADSCSSAMLGLFRKLGGTMLDCTPVSGIRPGSPLEVKTTSRTFFCKKLIVSAGPWAAPLLKQVDLELPLRLESVTVCFWRSRSNPGNISLDKFPCFIDLSNGIYSLPSFEYPGLIKLVNAATNELCETAEKRDVATRTSSELVKFYKPYLTEHFPVLETVPSVCERCMYTKTPDYGWIIDKHPKHDNILILAGFSGHGFKAASLIGKLASELTSKDHRASRYNLDEFKLSRFN